MNPLKHIDWKIVGSIVVGAYVLAILEAVTPEYSPSGIASKAAAATDKVTA